MTPDTPAAVCVNLLARGFTLAATPAGGLLVEPRAALTPRDVADVRRHRAGLLALAGCRTAWEVWFVGWPGRGEAAGGPVEYLGWTDYGRRK